jgi:penicillin-binding protein 1C
VAIFQPLADDLTWAEAATLAVLPNQPSLVHPGADRAALLAKRDRLLHMLSARGIVDGRTLELSLANPFP